MSRLTALLILVVFAAFLPPEALAEGAKSWSIAYSATSYTAHNPRTEGAGVLNVQIDNAGKIVGQYVSRLNRTFPLGGTQDSNGTVTLRVQTAPVTRPDGVTSPSELLFRFNGKTVGSIEGTVKVSVIGGAVWDGKATLKELAQPSWFFTPIEPLGSSVPAQCSQFHGAWGKGTWRSGRAVEIWVSSIRPDCTATVWEVVGKTPGKMDDFWVKEVKNVSITKSFILPGPQTDNTYELRDGKLVGLSRDKQGNVVSETTPLEKLSP